MKRRLFSLVLALCMVLSLLPAAALAAGTFADVPAGEWYADEVEYVYANGLMNGTGDGTAFDPTGNVSRAMVWTTLARMDGTDTTGSSPWYLAGQNWAMNNGVSDGTGAANDITREQLATMLFRYAQMKGYDVSVGEDTNILSYTDAFSVSDWAYAALQWACGAGIINGTDGALKPQGSASRAELAVMLYRFMENVVKAEPEVVTYTVTFVMDAEDGDVYEVVEVAEGETVGSLKNPTLSGYSFGGWYTEDGERFTLNTPVTEDIVVYAKWSKAETNVHTHNFRNWTANGDGTHTGTCICGRTFTDECIIGRDNVCILCEAAYPTTADELQTALEKGGHVQLAEDIELTETLEIPEGVEVILDLNGKEVTVGYQEGSSTNHLYAITNYGTLTIQGNGTINSRGIFNYGNLCLESGTINSIDGNGGYAVRNYEGSTFTMNGGTLATTYEDDNLVDKGGYDATPLRVDAGATATINGGTINNICDYTFAIENYGTVNVTGGTVTSVHTTISTRGTMNISGGSFTCNGLEGITAHTLVAWNGSTTTISGGTFDGKDNYNGFNVDAGEGSNVTITGGAFLKVHSGSLYGKGTIAVSGGTFFDDPSDRVAPGYIAEASGSTWTVRALKADDEETVAGVGGVYYEKLSEAAAAAEPGDTITLGNDINVEKDVKELPWGDSYSNLKSEHSLSGQNITVSGGSMTLDNGYVFGLTVFSEGGDITLKNMTVTGNSQSDIYIQTNGGKVTLDGVSVTSNGGSGIYAEFAEDGVILENCTVKQNGLGSGYKSWFETAVAAAQGSKITINSGTYESTGWAVYCFGSNSSVVTINGGTFVGKLQANDNDQIIIKGGTFSVDPASYVADGYQVIELGNGKYTVCPKTSVGVDSNGNWEIKDAEGLATLTDAINSGDDMDGKTITLPENATIDMSTVKWTPVGTSSSKSFEGTFDGNGATITGLDVLEGIYADGRGVLYGAALFGNLTDGAVIKDVTIDGATIYVEEKDGRANVVGVIAAYAYGDVTFENVHVINCEVYGYGKVGGILGMAADSSGSVTMKNCSVKNTTIYGTYNCGALIGLAQCGVTLEKCEVEGNTWVPATGETYNGNYWVYSDEWWYAAWGELYCDYVTTTENGVGYVGKCHDAVEE